MNFEQYNINLEHYINRVLAEKIKNNDRDYSHFHPSEFAQCHRKLVYKFYEAQGICAASEPNVRYIDPQLQRVFDCGHHLHFRLGKNMEGTGLLKGCWACLECKKRYGDDKKLGVHKPKICTEDSCISERFRYIEKGFMDEETLLGGHVDAILDLREETINDVAIPPDAPEEDSHIVVDFKSIRGEAFRKLIGPKDEHFTQMQIYLYLTGLKAGKLLYECKNTQAFREFLIGRDDEFIEAQSMAAKRLKKIVTSSNSEGQRTLPPRAHKKDNMKECVECPFRSHCWGLKK